jgi:cellulose synthase/poly-beta-1,6-N-acetylglucosamine synthase-like glycosyltransferase
LPALGQFASPEKTRVRTAAAKAFESSFSGHCPTQPDKKKPSELKAHQAQMKLIIQVPCFNEEATLGLTLYELPRQLPGIDQIERLIINDGSTDRTLEVAREHGVEHIVSFK